MPERTTLKPAGNIRRQVLANGLNLREAKYNRSEKSSPASSDCESSHVSKHLLKVYPIAINRSNSSSTLSALSQNSNDSTFKVSVPSWSLKMPTSFHELKSCLRKEKPAANDESQRLRSRDGKLKRCHWITNGSDPMYVQFHDQQWGVPVYDDNRLFELLALSGMLSDYSWTEILSKIELYREVFAGFDANVVAKMKEKQIIEISSNKKFMLSESRVRCIIDNAKCIPKIVKEFGSFSNYLWGYFNYRPIINRYKYPRNVPPRTPKAEAISKDLIKRGFRFVGPMIIYSFMQASGMSMDHLVDCFRFNECVGLVERDHQAW